MKAYQKTQQWRWCSCAWGGSRSQGHCLGCSESAHWGKWLERYCCFLADGFSLPPLSLSHSLSLSTPNSIFDLFFFCIPFTFYVHILSVCTIVQGGRRRGRQRKRWEDNIKEWTGIEWNTMLRKAENREEWRKLVVKSTVVPQRSARLRDR